MADWKKTYEIEVTNRNGYSTKFQIWEYLSSTPSVKKLPLLNIPMIEFSSPQYGIGVMNYRTTVTLLNDYQGNDIAETIRTSEKGSLKFVISVKLDSSTEIEAFSGFVDTRFFEQYLSSGAVVFDVDFISGLASNRDIPMLSDDVTDLADIIEYHSGGYANMNTMFYQITRKLTGYGDHVLYAFSNIEFEEWRYYIYGGTFNIPDPNVIFNEMQIDIIGPNSPFAASDTLEKIINDLCYTFFGVFGYSQTYEKLCFHHYFLGRKGDSYTIITKGPDGMTDMENDTYVLQSISRSNFYREIRPRRIIYPPIRSISVSREGFEALPEHPTSIAYNNNVITNQYTLEGLEHHIQSNFASFQYEVTTSDDPVGSPYFPPGRIIDRNEQFPTLRDITEILSHWWASLLFTQREGLKGRINKFLDPMFPFKYNDDGTIHRMIQGRQDPVKLTTEFESIEIGPDDPTEI